MCGQCDRLGHNCDYNPRLSFRDDTPRVVERMQDVTTIEKSIWDRQYHPSTHQACTNPSPASSPHQTDGGAAAPADDLPPFATLTTDEDRERKAERMSPGTYNVVVNPESFQHMPEYSEDPDIKSSRLSPLRRGSLATSLASSLGKESPLDGASASGDPNIVVLPRFEDTARRATSQWRDPRSPTSLLLPGKIKIEEQDSPADVTMMRRTIISHPVHEEQDSRYLEQFRNVVWKQLVQAEPGSTATNPNPSSSADVMEQVAAQFPPVSYFRGAH